jgi:hypothetical protein
VTILTPLDRPRAVAPRSPVTPQATPPRGSPPPDAGTDWWKWLLVGLVAAWVSGFVLPRNFSWFLAALPHEFGHAVAGCLLGRPSTPAISLMGEAWTTVADLQPFLVWLVAAGCAGAAFALRARRAACAALCAGAVVIPLVAFGETAAELVVVAAGHLGELAFATWCFHLVATGGYTGTPKERAGSAMAGGLLQFVNLRLCAGLLTSVDARAEYAGNGSLGLKNDYLRLAEDLLECRLQTVAAVMLLLSLLPLPLGLAIGWWRASRDG